MIENAFASQPAPREPLHLLIIENDEADAELCLRELKKANLEVSADVVQTMEDFRRRLASHTYDLVLADYNLPGWQGLEALEQLHEARLDIPFVLVTGTLGEEAAVECIKSGVSDYVLKDSLVRLPIAVRRALEEKALRRERTNAELALRASERRYRLLFERNLAGVYSITLGGRIMDLNDACARILGYSSREEVMKHTLWEISSRTNHLKELIELLQSQESYTNLEVCLRRIDGRPVWVLANATLLEREERGERIIQGSLIDITERKRLEAQLRQAAKMEAVGRLAGGVAHDFNNLLTAILGYSDLVLERLPAKSPLRRHIAEVKNAGERAASLTRQLLAFSRRQVLAPQVLDLNLVVANMNQMLLRLIGEDIELISKPQPGLGSVKADPSQIEQVILNLAVNSRDAMPSGGRLTIETANVYLDQAFAQEQPFYVQPGPYVTLAVTDTGCGMDSETKAHIFEPFFTTKETDKGTGLGLATVYGVVKQSDGYILVQTEPGQGTSFKIYLPQIEEAAATPPSRSLASAPSQGVETILLVEDELAVRDLMRRILQSRGYEVLEAGGGKEALEVAARHCGTISLIVTDVIMPRLSGPDLARQINLLRPGIKVLYTSGYTGGPVGRLDILDPNAAFIHKPFTAEAFLRKVRETLDTEAARFEMARSTATSGQG